MTWSRVKPRSQVHGSDHAKARKAWAARHQPTDLCYRCRKPLGPMGPWLHLDHDDHNKTVYHGFSHAKCNIRAAAELGRRRQQGGGGPTPVRSRDWIWGTRVKTPRVPKPKVAKPVQVKTCALCQSSYIGGGRKYCSSACMWEMNNRSTRERYRARVGLPPTWDRPSKPHGA